MRYFKGFYMSLGMFCAIPLPVHVWDEKHTSVMMASFPFVGLITGAVWWLAAVLLTVLDTPLMLTAAVLSVMPFFLYGFIHLDGYMDASDALMSRRPTEDKLRILKDPNVGAFAVVMLGVLFILQFSAMHAVIEHGEFLALLIVISVISRCCAAFSNFALPHIPQSGYAALLKQNARTSHKIFVILVAAATVTASFLYAGVSGLAVSGIVILGYFAAIAHAFKGLKGISGDLLGYALVISELCGLVAFAVIQGRFT